MSFESESGGLFFRVMFNRLKMTLLNFESVRLAKNLYNLTSNWTYGLADLVTRTLDFTRPPASISIPMAGERVACEQLPKPF